MPVALRTILPLRPVPLSSNARMVWRESSFDVGLSTCPVSLVDSQDQNRTSQSLRMVMLMRLDQTVVTGAAVRPRQDTTTTASFTNSVVCSTTTTVTISTCTPVTEASTTTSSCFETPKATLVCDSANICMKDKLGIDICMLKQNAPTTDGLVITIFLALVFSLGVSTMIFLCCKDKREEKRRKAQQEAAEILKSNTHAARAAARVPTAPAGGAPGADPFADPNRQH